MAEQQEEGFVPEGESRRLPMYLLLDTSGSMSGAPIQAVNNGLADFEHALKNDPHALETAHVSVVEFSSDANQVAPLADAASFQAPSLSAGGSTSLGEALELLKDRMDEEVRSRSSDYRGDWKPLVFLFTDGYPTDDWEPALDAFEQSEQGSAANVIAIGCGPDVDESVLERIAGPEQTLLSKELNEERISSLFQWITQSAKNASKAASVGAKDGGADGGEANAGLPPVPEGIQLARD